MKRFESLVTMTTSIGEAISHMGSLPSNKHIAGMVVIVDAAKKVLGVATDGDVRRGIAKGLTLDQPVSAIANLTPMTVNRHLRPILMRRAVMDDARARNTNYLKYDRLILVENDGTFYDVIRLSDIMESQIDEKVIAVYGLGFVGLTLACTLANAGLSVVGIDTSITHIDMLKKGTAPFYEKGLDSMLSSLASTNPIFYTVNAAQKNADVHIVSVGSPVTADGTPDLSHIQTAATTIAALLKAGDLVVFRSTVPVGTMRQVVLPILESGGRTCGQDFHLAFAPERTVEGNALEELRLLPQIVGGFNRTSRTQAAKLFRQITNTIIEVNSLEEAEMVKLMNNTFRDLVFAFANESASICESFNIDAFDLIRAANEGYPRDRIPMPSPGVGGICLSKDPFLYTHPMAKLERAPVLGKASRSVNSAGNTQLIAKLSQFAKHTGKRLDALQILMVGLAFKGMPETSDIRASVGLDLIEKLPSRQNIHVKDFVVSSAVISALGCTPVEGSIAEALQEVDAVLIMNNHYLNNKFNVVDAMRSTKTSKFLFDGWHMFNRRELEALPHVCYATLGYMTPEYRG